jgi:hypothetical protein
VKLLAEMIRERQRRLEAAARGGGNGQARLAQRAVQGAAEAGQGQGE